MVPTASSAPTRSPAQFARLDPRLLAVLALFLVNVIWGTTFVVSKPLLITVPPITLAALRFGIASAVLFPILLTTGRRPLLNRTTAALAFAGVFVTYVCQNVGLTATTAANGALIHGGIPAFTALIATLVLGERLDARRLAGLGLSLTGVAVIVLGNGARLGVSARGDGLVLLSAFGLAAYFVLGRRAFPTGGSLALVGGVSGWGFLMLLPASGLELATGTRFAPTASDLPGLLYLGAAASALAFVLWGYALGQLEASQAAVFTNLTPLVGVVVAVWALGEPLTTTRLLGGGLILAGVWIISRRAQECRTAEMTSRPVPSAVPLTAD